MLRNLVDYIIIPFSTYGMLRNLTNCATMLPFEFRHVTKLHELPNDGCQVPQNGQMKVACHQARPGELGCFLQKQLPSRGIFWTDQVGLVAICTPIFTKYNPYLFLVILFL